MISSSRPIVRLILAIACAITAAGGPGGASSAAVPAIPLCAGLTIVTAVSEPEGDYESIKTVEAVDGAGVHFRYAVERVIRDLPGRPIQKFNKPRLVRTVDLRDATRYMQEFGTNMPDEIPGATAVGTSSAVLRRLKETGGAELTVFDLPPFKSSRTYSTDRKASPNVYEYELPFKLRRVEQPAALAIAVNGEKVELPVIHALGTAEWGEKSEFYFLDNPANPLALRWRIRTSSISTNDRLALEVVRIAFHCDARGTASPLETALLERGRADVYEIYFSFNSDEIREESEPVLRELTDILVRHPDWKLSIEGHTDGIASDSFNLDLSRRRAAAVKSALVTRFGIAETRLATAGYGKSRPKDTNATPEGRAMNRRVELVRQ